MLLPWKKKLSGGSGGRFSRLVADLQTPPKRGGSLVVQSDFPASIIGLFVKKGERDKKPAKNRRKRGKQQRQLVAGAEAPSATVPDPEGENCDSPQQALNSSTEEEEEETDDSGAVETSEESDISDLDGASSSRFLEVAVVAILCLLALFKKWLVIGATIAALSLLFVEFGARDSPSPSGGKTVTLEAYGPVIGVSRSLETNSHHQLDSGKSDSSKSEKKSEETEVRESNLETAAALEDTSASNAEDDAVVGESCENQELPRRRRKLKSKIIKRVVPKKIRSHMKEL